MEIQDWFAAIFTFITAVSGCIVAYYYKKVLKIKTDIINALNASNKTVREDLKTAKDGIKDLNNTQAKFIENAQKYTQLIDIEKLKNYTELEVKTKENEYKLMFDNAKSQMSKVKKEIIIQGVEEKCGEVVRLHKELMHYNIWQLMYKYENWKDRIPEIGEYTKMAFPQNHQLMQDHFYYYKKVQEESEKNDLDSEDEENQNG